MKPRGPTRYDDERLGRLLALLRAAPKAWIDRAKRIPFAITDEDVAELARRLEVDPTFRKSFDMDPVAAVEGARMPKLAARLKRELEELVAVAERIAAGEDSQATLADVGFPDEAAEPLLEALELPAGELEVAAHARRTEPLRARLLRLLLTSGAVVERIRR
jgi:hypothetical protein